MTKIDISQKMDQGWIRLNGIFQIIGQPKKHVEDTIKTYVQTIKTTEGIEIINEDYETAEEVEEGTFSAIVEVDMIVHGFEKLNWLCMSFTPASIEIIEPKTITLTDKEGTHWANDLLAKLHELGILQKSAKTLQEGLVRNFNAMTRNAILLCLTEPRTIEEITKKIGMTQEHTNMFLEALIKEKKIVEEKGKYRKK